LKFANVIVVAARSGDELIRELTDLRAKEVEFTQGNAHAGIYYSQCACARAVAVRRCRR
jgi:hypothetical protein